jgi:hypothetical protein
MKINLEDLLNSKGVPETLRVAVRQLSKEAMLYRGLKSLAKEQLIHPESIRSIVPDYRRQFKLPLLISYDALGINYSFDEAVGNLIEEDKHDSF